MLFFGTVGDIACPEYVVYPGITGSLDGFVYANSLCTSKSSHSVTPVVWTTKAVIGITLRPVAA